MNKQRFDDYIFVVDVGPHRMRDVRTIAIGDPGRLSV